ncbi:predicted protein [Histoplasma capsulatum G186AR]|uniref:Uncharacterized protein n=1 Tax=Ajellomyces capsulatus (strain G186AR / H82 / ATCC MYA-2454 / RMSCC 2432) TaxID=447093 RepID=C0NES3_AJECG|nr:uncharacterized protein HCBG_01389 [Histoplasma capsulatum G186AR]EEH09744.1 predicted protein [Histoplasma capsulatum G186AR]
MDLQLHAEEPAVSISSSFLGGFRSRGFKVCPVVCHVGSNGSSIAPWLWSWQQRDRCLSIHVHPLGISFDSQQHDIDRKDDILYTMSKDLAWPVAENRSALSICQAGRGECLGEAFSTFYIPLATIFRRQAILIFAPLETSFFSSHGGHSLQTAFEGIPVNVCLTVKSFGMFPAFMQLGHRELPPEEIRARSSPLTTAVSFTSSRGTTDLASHGVAILAHRDLFITLVQLWEGRD